LACPTGLITTCPPEQLKTDHEVAGAGVIVMFVLVTVPQSTSSLKLIVTSLSRVTFVSVSAGEVAGRDRSIVTLSPAASKFELNKVHIDAVLIVASFVTIDEISCVIVHLKVLS
jgi:hypothetical protein